MGTKTILLMKILSDVAISAINTINEVNNMTDVELDEAIEMWDKRRKELMNKLKTR